MSDCSENQSSGSAAKRRRPSTPVLKKRQRHEDTKRKHLPQRYKREWESTYKPWLTSVEDSAFTAKCTVCNVRMVSELTVIKKHDASKKHVTLMSNLKSNKRMSQFVKSGHDAAAELTKIAEIKISGFLAEHNIAFLAVDHLTPLLKEIFPDSQIAQKLTLKRTKSTKIVTEVIAKDHFKVLASILAESKFSIMIDESTDVSSIKSVCIVVRFFSKPDKKIVSKFWNLQQLFDTADNAAEGATAERIYKTVMKTFETPDIKIPYANIIGFGSDGCNTMFGSKSSVTTRIRSDCPGAYVQKCVCHSLHLVASKAAAELPRRCEDMARDIYNFFKSSAKRQSQFKEFQEFCNTEPHKILRPAQTRWLSLLEVVQRILEQWNALQLFFNHAKFDAKLLAADNIHSFLHDPEVKLYYAFLEWVLQKIVLVNKNFQSEGVIITKIHNIMESLIKDLFCSYMENGFVARTDVINIDPNDVNKFLPLQQTYLGIKVTKLKNELPNNGNTHNMLAHFNTRCRNFLITACDQIKKRYDYGNKLFGLIACLTPQNALNKSRKTSSLMEIMTLCPRIVPFENENLTQNIDNEWRSLIVTAIPNDIANISAIDEFWYAIGQVQSNNDTYIFENLSHFCLNVLSLPISNASCERVFSKVNLLKTPIRNSLMNKTVNGLLLTSQCVQNCVNFRPSKEMLRYHTAENLYSDTKDVVGDHATVEDILFEA